MKTKTFDCVEMKRRGALRIHERLKGMTFEQKVDYWRERSEAFRQEQAACRNADRNTPAAAADDE